MSIKGFYYFFRAKVIFTNNNEFYRFKSSDQILIDFWHGIPIKSILNYDSRLTNRFRTFASGTTYRVSSSRFVTILLSSAFGNSPFTYLETGSVRADRLLSDQGLVFHNILPSIPVGLKIALFMPTYRKGYGQRNDGNDYFDTKTLSEMSSTLLKYGYFLVVKPHPFEEEMWIKKYSNVITSKVLNTFNYISCDILSSTDLLITDYSSVLIDFLLLRRPFIILNTDYKSYEENRGFIFDVADYLKCNTLKNFNEFDQLLQSVLDNKSPENVEFLIKLFFNNCDIGNAERLTLKLTDLHKDVF